MSFVRLTFSFFLILHIGFDCYSFQVNVDESIKNADSLYSQKKYSQAIEIYTDLIANYDLAIKQPDSQAQLLDKLGTYYSTIGKDFQQALYYYEQSLKTRQSDPNSESLWQSYYYVGTANFRIKDLENAQKYFLFSLDSRKNFFEKEELEDANILYMLGVIEKANLKNTFSEQSLINAEKYLEQSLNIYQSLNNSIYSLIVTLELADLCIQNKQYEKALNYLPTKEIESINVNTRIRFYSLLSQAHSGLGSFDSAYYYKSEENQAIRTSISQNQLSSVAKITEDYRTDKQLDQAEETAFLASQRAKTYGIAALILLLILAVSYLIFLQTIQRKKLENLQAVVLGEEQERKRLAKDLHDGIGVLLTSIRMRLSSFEEKVDDQEAYHNSLEQIDNACTEVRRVSHNLSPASLEKLGLEEALLDLVDQVKLTGDLEVKEEVSIEQGLLKTEDEVLVYRIVQELFNNTLKYAEASKIELSLLKEANNLRLSFNDNGKGFDQQKVKPGIGLKSIASRLDILKGKMNFNSQLGKGTHFEISIPIHV